MQRSLAAGRTGSINGKFCHNRIANCKDDFKKVIQVAADYKMRDYGDPKATLFPADPILMKSLADVFINNPRPRFKEPWDLLKGVFDDYRERGRFRKLVKDGACNLEDGTVVFEDVPEGEWIVYARLECEDAYWDNFYNYAKDRRVRDIISSSRYCDVWIVFCNVKAVEQTELKPFYFGSGGGNVIYTNRDWL